jgi:hypothetical protein
VPPGGKNWRSEYVSEGKYNSINVHVTATRLKKSPKTSLLGNLDWFTLIITLFKAGATQVNVFGKQFHSSDEYIAFVDDTSNGYFADDLLTEEKLRGVDVLGGYGWRDDKPADIFHTSVKQSDLSAECWTVQFQGLSACETCEAKGTADCGGKKILQTGKNEKGIAVPLADQTKK